MSGEGSRQEVRREISRAALEEIFSDKPVTEQDDFVTSVLLETRTVMAEGACVPRSRTFYSPTPTLPDWLQGSYRLPPWEARLLNLLFAFDLPVLMIRGGSGSGKTSAVKLLDRYCQKTLRETRSSLNNVYGFRSPFLCLEIQSFPDELVTRREDPDHIQLQIERAFDELAEIIDGCLGIEVPRENFAMLFYNAIVVPPRPGRSSAGKLAAVREKLYENLVEIVDNPDLKNGVGDRVTILQAKSALKRLSQARDRLAARILLLAEIGRAISKDDGLPLTLVLDNVDPLPEYLQRKLFQELESIGFGLQPLFLKIAVFARLSTAARYLMVGAHAGAEGIEEFHSSDPASLVVWRAARFLLSPDRYRVFRSLHSNEQAYITRRVLMLWRHLEDASGEFRSVLSGLAGSNIRNAFLFARNWCLSPRWRQQQVPLEAFEYSQSFRRAAAIAFLYELGESFYRGMPLIGSRHDIDCMRSTNKTPSDLAKAVADSMGRTLAHILRDHRLIRESSDLEMGTFPEPSKCIRRFLSESICAEIDLFLESDRSIDIGLRADTFLFFELSGYHLYQRLRVDESHFLTRELGIAFSRHLEVAHSWSTGIIPKLRNEIIRAVARGAYVETGVAEVQARKESWAHSVLAPLDASSRRPSDSRESRFRAATVLIDPELPGEPFEQCAANLFCVDNQGICALPLYSLRLLAEVTIGLQRQQFLRDLEILGFSAKEIDNGLTEMVRKERRLIYSSVRDHHDGIQSWRDNADPLVHISNSGVSYLEDLSRSPAYLQWSLSRAREITNRLRQGGLGGQETAIARIQSARYSFVWLLDGERARMTSDRWTSLLLGGNRFREDQEARCQSPILTTLVNAVHYFLQDIAAHTGNLRRRRLDSEVAAATAEAREWLLLAEAGIEKHREVHDTVDPKWLEELGFCGSFFRTQFGDSLRKVKLVRKSATG